MQEKRGRLLAEKRQILTSFGDEEKNSTLITGLFLAALPEENVKSRFAFLSGLGAFDSRQEFCASEKELNLFVNASSERTSLGPAKDMDKICVISSSN